MKKRSNLTVSKFESKSITEDGLTLKDVLVIECGPAKGHYCVQYGSSMVNYDPYNPEHGKLQRLQIMIDPLMLQQVVESGNGRPEIKCKLNHGDSVGEVVGGYKNFRVEGEQVRADLTLMKSSNQREYVLELASRFAGEVGNSIDFDYTYEQGKNPQSQAMSDFAVARCRKLNSVDIVDAPAATSSLFEENHDPKTAYDMPLSPEDLAAIGGIMDTKLAAVQAENKTQFTALSTKLEEVEKKVDEDEESEEDKKKKKDEEDAKAEMAKIAGTAALAAVQSIFPKVGVTNLSKGNGGGDEENFEAKIQAELGTGAKNRGQAIAFAARKHPALYNVFMSADKKA